MLRVLARVGWFAGTLALLGACARHTDDAPAGSLTNNELTNNELTWARAALERNPKYKVVSTDAANNTIQVRVQATGEMLTFRPGELAAVPIGDLLAVNNQAEAQPEPPPPTRPAPVAPPPPETPTATTSANPAQPETPQYKVERENGRVRVTGPGISIETHRSDAHPSAPKRYDDEPFVCDGKRMLHLDNRQLSVSGDGVTVRGGCELYITNSRIDASGTGIVVLDGIAHIANSQIDGADGSLTTSSAARVYLQGNTFSGVIRRDPASLIQDQGNNTWH